MPIHQALITDIIGPSVRTWSNVTSGIISSSSVTFTNLQTNDLIFIVAGADDTDGLESESISGWTTIVADEENSISHYISYKIYTGSNGTEIIPRVGSNMDADYSFAFAMRSSTAFSTLTVTIEKDYETSGTPSHGNENVSFAAGDLALLIAYQDDDNASPMIPPSDSTDIAEDVEGGDGSAGAAFKSIQTAGNYSWGSWSTSGSDRTLSYIIKVSN